MILEDDNVPRGRITKGRIPILPDAQTTQLYTAYVRAFDAAVGTYNENFLDQPFPKYLNDPEPYKGYNFDQFMPISGYGLMTAGRISLDDTKYG